MSEEHYDHRRVITLMEGLGFKFTSGMNETLKQMLRQPLAASGGGDFPSTLPCFPITYGEPISLPLAKKWLNSLRTKMDIRSDFEVRWVRHPSYLLAAEDNSLVIFWLMQEDRETHEPCVLLEAWDTTPADLIKGLKEVPSPYEEVVKKPRGIFMIVPSPGGGYTLQEAPHSPPGEYDEEFFRLCYGDAGVAMFEQLKSTDPEKNNPLDQGLTMLLGDPGGGKSTFLQYLAQQTPERRFIFVPPGTIPHLGDPAFAQFLLTTLKEEPSVLVTEDGEQLLTGGRTSGMSTLLNLADGIFGRVSGCSILTTFNVEIGKIDPAFLRPGRLRAKYEFRALEKPDAEALWAAVSKRRGETTVPPLPKPRGKRGGWMLADLVAPAIVDPQAAEAASGFGERPVRAFGG